MLRAVVLPGPRGGDIAAVVIAEPGEPLAGLPGASVRCSPCGAGLGGLRRSGASAAAAARVWLNSCAHEVKAGHQMRLLIAGACHPRYARNEGPVNYPVPETS
ncbi:hypothetical protein [Streptomyces sp. NPDC054962]